MRERGFDTRPARRARRALALGVALIGVLASACGGSTAPTASGTATAKPSPTGVPLDAALATQSVFVGDLNGTGTSSPGGLFALNAQTGAVRWSFAPRALAGTPVLANGTVYIAPEDGNAYAVDAATGTPRWTFQRTGGSANTGFDGYTAVEGPVVYVTSDFGSVFALNTSGGSQKWRVTLTSDLDHIYTAPAVANGLVYVSVGGFDNEVLALDAATGKTRWTLKGDQEFDGTPLVAGGTVYVGGGLTLYAVNATTGTVRWRFTTTGDILTRPAFGNGLVYLGSADETVYAVDATTGTERWHFKTGGVAPGPLIATGAAVTLDGDTLYAGSQGGILYALNAADATVRWQHALGAAIDSPVAVAGGAVFAATDKATVYALRASDGALSWQHDEPGSIFGSPVVG
jgi:outer membrane protein assembly factor BamB